MAALPLRLTRNVYLLGRLIARVAYQSGSNLIKDGWRIGRVLAHGRVLRCIQDNTRKIRAGDVLLVCWLRNECLRMPFFLDYYRALGVHHFLLVDNDSSDGFRDWVARFADCSVWHTKTSPVEAGLGLDWCNYLLCRYGSGHLCVTVAPDEFLVYPRCDFRELAALGQFIKDDYREQMHVLTVDCYSDRRVDETVYRAGDDPFAVCPFFDRDGYIQTRAPDHCTYLQGGPLMRVFNLDTPAAAPALNKAPVVWWERHYAYRNGTHSLIPRRLNWAHKPGEVSITGVLFRFGLVTTPADGPAEEVEREHLPSGWREYLRAREAAGMSLYRDGISVRYESVDQLSRLGLMSAASWV